MSKLVIYIGENEHGDMSYGSLTEQIIRDCESSKLKTQLFFEFPSQDEKSKEQKARIVGSSRERVSSFVLDLQNLCSDERGNLNPVHLSKVSGIVKKVLGDEDSEDVIKLLTTASERGLRLSDTEITEKLSNPDGLKAIDNAISNKSSSLEKEFERIALDPLKNYRSRTPALMTLENSRESVEATAAFLDERLVTMDSLNERWRRAEEFWDNLSEEEKNMSPKELFNKLKDGIDNVEIVKALRAEIEVDVGPLFGIRNNEKNNPENLHRFYKMFSNPLSLRQSHEKAAEDIRSHLATDTDVVIIVIGSSHIPGLDAQMPELKGSKKLVVGNYPENLTGVDYIMYSGASLPLSAVADVVGFDVSYKEKRAIVPKEIKQAIRDTEKTKLDALDLATPPNPSSNPERPKISRVKGSNFNEI